VSNQEELHENRLEKATLGGGCFWCLEAVYQDVEGVVDVENGYAGGTLANPTYEAVCRGTTGHAEVVQITFDPDVITYREILEIFFAIHDPTTPNRQGNDIGTQYRSVIFYHSPDQHKVAQEVMAEIAEADLWDGPLVTELTPAPTFYPAEDYHRRYYKANPFQPYCMFVIRPKVAKFRRGFAHKLRARS